MKKKYGIALIPKVKIKKFISLACNKATNAVDYCVGDGSFPHVTICQFYYELKNISALWVALCNQLDEFQINLTFKKYSHITFGGDIHWVSLIPEEGNELKNLFSIISTYVKPIRSDQYDPHLTLFNYKSCEKDALDLVESINISDKFDLILGEFDEVGQLVRILRKDPIARPKSNI